MTTEESKQFLERRLGIVLSGVYAHSGQLLFVTMRSSAPASCASQGIGPSLDTRPPAPDAGPLYLEEAMPDN